MATGAEAIEAIGAAASPGIHPGAVASVARALREADNDLWPMAKGRGGGKNSAPVERHHLGNLILGLTAASPSEAPAAVATLRNLSFARRQTVMAVALKPTNVAGEMKPLELTGWIENMDHRAAGSFGEWIENWIDDNRDQAHREALAAHNSDLDISMSVLPAVAILTTYTSNGRHESVFLNREDAEQDRGEWPPRIIRQARKTTTLPYSIITVAGALWGDTVARRAVMTTRSLLSSAVPNAQAGSENARAAVPTATRALTSYPSEGHAKAES